MYSIRRIGRFAPGTLVPLFAAVVYGCADTSSSPNRVSADSSTARMAVAASGSGLVAAYGFDEASGTATQDASGNSNNGSTGSGVSRTTSGRFGGALSFDGSGMVTIPDAASLRLTSAMTLEAWVNPSTVNSSWRDVIYKGDDNYYLMATSTNGSRAAGGASFGNTSATVEAYGTSALAANTWSHLAVTFDGTTIRLYVNGAQVSTRARSGSFTTSSNPLQIGGNRFYTQYFQGKIDEVRVYNRPLSATEIQSDMNTAVTKGSSGGSATLPPPVVVVPTAKALAVQTQPGSATSALPFVIQPVVRIADSVGGVISGSTAQVTAVLASGSGTLSGTTTVSAVNGVASFTNLAITGSGNFTIKFSSGSLTAATSNTFAVSAQASKPASQLAITAQPSASATSGVAFAQQPSIVLRDASGSTVAQAGMTVTAAIATGGGTLGGTASATTNASGVATFSNLSITGTTGSRTLRFASGSMTAATSNAVTVTAPSAPVATQVGISAQATSGQSGVALSPATVVQLKDASGNAISQSGVTVTATLASGAATIGGTLTATTAANGSATFSNIVLTGSGTQTLRFTTSSGFSATSAAISIAASASSGGSTGGSGTVTAPNLLNNASFESGWEGFTNWTGAGTPSGVTRDNTMGYDGSWSIKRAWTPNPSADGGSQFLYKYGTSDRVYMRFYFKMTAPISTIMKFARYYNDAFSVNLGGLFVQNGANILGWGWDQENSAIVTRIGLSEAQVIDGKWHSLEVDYWRNGDPSGQPSVAFWFDGASIGLPDGTGGVQYAGSGNSSYWKGNRLYAGMRSSSVKLGYQEWLATLNAGNTTTGQVNIDRVSYSTAGRIGQ